MPVDVRDSGLGFGSERGIFGIDPRADRAEGVGEHLGRWRNIDYLRLKDFLLHQLNPRPGMTIFEMGCANGAQMVYCGLQGAEVYGQDLDAGLVEHANRKLRHLGIKGEARVGDVQRLDFPDDMFDAVVSSDFHEHLTPPQQVAALAEARRVLKPGGVLFLKTPNLGYLRLSLNFKRLRALARLKSPRGFVIPHSPGTHDPQHVGLTTRACLDKELAEAGYLNWEYFHAPLWRFGRRRIVEVLSTEAPVLRDFFCEDLFCRAWKPIALSHFPE